MPAVIWPVVDCNNYKKGGSFEPPNIFILSQSKRNVNSKVSVWSANLYFAQKHMVKFVDNPKLIFEKRCGTL